MNSRRATRWWSISFWIAVGALASTIARAQMAKEISDPRTIERDASGFVIFFGAAEIDGKWRNVRLRLHEDAIRAAVEVSFEHYYGAVEDPLAADKKE